MKMIFRILTLSALGFLSLQVKGQVVSPERAQTKKIQAAKAADVKAAKADASESAASGYSSTAAASAPGAPVSTSGTLVNGQALRKNGTALTAPEPGSKGRKKPAKTPH